MIKVVVVDDYAPLRSMTVEAIGRDPDILVVGESGTGPKMWTLLAENEPDILWLSSSKYEFDEFQFISELQDRYPGLKIVFDAILNYQYYLKRLLKLGLAGYKLKDDKLSIAPQMIRQVHRGETYISETFAEALEDCLAGRPLSLRELEVLELMARDVSAEEIATRLYISPRTVASHMGNIRRKLDVCDTTAALAKARELGLVE
jgi:DNA-binding NarL/FixJ family response regulator